MISTDKCFSVNIKAIWAEFKRQPFHFWFLCGYLFFEYFRPQTIYPAIDILPWAKVMVILAAIGTFASKESVPSAAPLAKYFWGLVFAVFCSCIFAEFPGTAFSNINAVLNWLIIYYLFVRIVTTKFRFFVVMFLIMLASFKMSQHAAISWAARGFAFARWGVAGTPGFFGNAADLGVQMLIVLPLSIAIIRNYYSSWGFLKKLIIVFFPITVVMAIIATGERNTLLGLASMGLVTAFAAKRRFKNMILISALGLCLIAVMPRALLDRFDTAGKDTTSQARLMYWKRGIQFFEEHPLLGIGYHNWVPYYVKYYPAEALTGKTQQVAHSTPIQILAELGLLGFIFYYGLAFKTILLNSRLIKSSRPNQERIWKDVSYALNIGLIGFLTSSIFITVTFYPFLFIQASLTASLRNMLLREDQNALPENENIEMSAVEKVMHRRVA
jgi:putative inorganic carbon (HCO3(-)) transporter